MSNTCVVHVNTGTLVSLTLRQDSCRDKELKPQGYIQAELKMPCLQNGKEADSVLLAAHASSILNIWSYSPTQDLHNFSY